MTAPFSRSLIAMLCGVLLCAAGAVAAEDAAPQAPAPAQATTEPEPSPQPAPAPTAPAPVPPAPPDYFFPEVAAKTLTHDGEHFFIKPILAFVGDYTWFSQDDASLAQVGEQKNAAEARAVRFGVLVRSKDRLKLEFYITGDHQEYRTREDMRFQVYDLLLRIPIGPVKIQIGKQKEQFGYELVDLSVMLPQQERILLPFYDSRSIGIQANGPIAHGRMTWAAGMFNDWIETDTSREDNQSTFTGRVTGLAWTSADNRDYLHLGLGLRYRSSDAGGLMRFAGRPESNVADKFTDTGDFTADHANQLSLEGLFSRGPFSILAERIEARVDAPESGDPVFWGAYITGSWVLTGESRVYNRAGGWAAGIPPKRRLGAVELVAKYSRVDLTDGAIDGGLLSKWHFGVNWWASAQWKFGLSYGIADLDKGGTRGRTGMLLFRFQWVFT